MIDVVSKADTTQAMVLPLNQQNPDIDSVSRSLRASLISKRHCSTEAKAKLDLRLEKVRQEVIASYYKDRPAVVRYLFFMTFNAVLRLSSLRNEWSR